MGKKRRAAMADQADRHHLYQQAVQCVEAEVDFVEQTFRAIRGRRAIRLREDFCGTANTSCEWVRRSRRHVALGVDLDRDVLSWGKKHNIAPLGKAARRVTLLDDNVLRVKSTGMDAVLAMNFSYWIFKERKMLRRYFKRVRDGLAGDGVFFLDAYGGHDAFKVMKDRHEYKKFTYIWDQAAYRPITGDILCHIHFEFADGSKLKRAFTYDWRLWTLPEIREILEEAGFSASTVYWQETDEETGEGNGVFTPSEEGEPDPAWIAYIVAEK